MPVVADSMSVRSMSGMVGRPATAWLPKGAASVSESRTLGVAAVSLVLLAASHHWLLALLNEHLFHATPAITAMADAGIVLGAIGLAFLRAPVPVLIGLSIILADASVRSVISGQLDPKSVRDLMVPLGFYLLGRHVLNPSLLRWAFWSVSTLIVVVGLAELLGGELYLQLVDPQSFFIARGLLDPADTSYLGEHAIPNGQRFGDRLLLPALGETRLGTIFIEPVTLGNFAGLSVIYAGAAFLGGRMREALCALAVAALAAIGADSRFAILVCGALAALTLAPRLIHRLLPPLLPVLFFVLLAAFSLNYGNGLTDTIAGRLSHSGHLLVSMDLSELLGLSRERNADDSGYYYSLTSFGLVLCTAAWAALCMLSAESPSGAYAKSAVAVLACSLLCISGASLFALKFAGLLWLILGVFTQPGFVRRQTVPNAGAGAQLRASTPPVAGGEHAA